MSSRNGGAQPKLTPFKPGENRRPGPHKPGPYMQAVLMQQGALRDFQDPKTKPSVRAALMRAWDVLEERKRILRGRPLPGQYRPDLHPDQLLKALKRAKIQRHGLLDLGTGALTEPREVEADTGTAPEPPPQPGPKPEPETTTDDRPTEPKVGG